MLCSIGLVWLGFVYVYVYERRIEVDGWVGG